MEESKRYPPASSPKRELDRRGLLVRFAGAASPIIAFAGINRSLSTATWWRRRMRAFSIRACVVCRCERYSTVYREHQSACVTACLCVRGEEAPPKPRCLFERKIRGRGKMHDALSRALFFRYCSNAKANSDARVAQLNRFRHPIASETRPQEFERRAWLVSYSVLTRRLAIGNERRQVSRKGTVKKPGFRSM